MSFTCKKCGDYWAENPHYCPPIRAEGLSRQGQTMKVFILYDDSERAYPIMGIFSTLKLAEEAAWEDGRGPGPSVCVYEELLDDAGKTVEPVYHEIKKP